MKNKKNNNLLKYATTNTSTLNELFQNKIFNGVVVNIHDSNIIDIVAEYPMKGTLTRYKCRLYGLISKKVFGANEYEINYNKNYLKKIFLELNNIVWIKSFNLKNDELMVKIFKKKKDAINDNNTINDQILFEGQSGSL